MIWMKPANTIIVIEDISTILKNIMCGSLLHVITQTAYRSDIRLRNTV